MIGAMAGASGIALGGPRLNASEPWVGGDRARVVAYAESGWIMTKCLRLGRLVKYQVFAQLEKTFNPGAVRLSKLLAVFLYSLHLMGCVWWGRFGADSIARGEDVNLRDAVFCEGGHGDHEHQSLELVDDDADQNFIYYQKVVIGI